MNVLVYKKTKSIYERSILQGYLVVTHIQLVNKVNDFDSSTAGLFRIQASY